MKEINIKEEASSLVNIFETFLDVLDITLPDKYREGDPDEARIYGDTYYQLEQELENFLRTFASDVQQGGEIV